MVVQKPANICTKWGKKCKQISKNGGQIPEISHKSIINHGINEIIIFCGRWSSLMYWRTCRMPNHILNMKVSASGCNERVGLDQHPLKYISEVFFHRRLSSLCCYITLICFHIFIPAFHRRLWPYGTTLTISSHAWAHDWCRLGVMDIHALPFSSRKDDLMCAVIWIPTSLTLQTFLKFPSVFSMTVK